MSYGMKIENINGSQMTLGDLCSGDVFQLSPGSFTYMKTDDPDGRSFVCLEDGELDKGSKNDEVYPVKCKLVLDDGA